MLGDLIGDVIWYQIGRHFGKPFIARFGKFFNITEEKVTKATEIFHKHKSKILIISKITNGFGLALVTLISAGIARIPFKHYLALNITGQLVWTGMLLFVGYFFGGFYTQMEAFMGRATAITMVIFGALIIFFLYKNISTALMRYNHLENQ